MVKSPPLEGAVTPAATAGVDVVVDVEPPSRVGVPFGCGLESVLRSEWMPLPWIEARRSERPGCGVGITL